MARQAYPDVPILIGGIEASLRRLSHYDYWDNKVRKSIIIDANANLLMYGMGENSIIEVAEALKEWEENNQIELEYENSEFGMFITGLGKDEAIQQNEKEQLYWRYDSKNNKSCVADGYCSAADSLEIADEDSFVFTLSKMQ